MTMTPQVYSMTMPSYANMTTVLHCFSQTKYIENLSLSQLSRESDVHMWTFCINSAIRELKGGRQKVRLCQSTLGLPRYFLYQILRLAGAKFISGASEDERKNTLNRKISNKQNSKEMSSLVIWRLFFYFKNKLLSHHHSKQVLRILFKTYHSPSEPSK